MTNLIITYSLVVEFHSSAMFSKRKNTNDRFSQLLVLILLFHVCRPIIFTTKKFFPEFHSLFQNFKEIITNAVFFGNFALNIFAHLKNKVSLEFSASQQFYLHIFVYSLTKFFRIGLMLLSRGVFRTLSNIYDGGFLRK